NQISGEINLNDTNLTKKEKNWNINKLLDMSKGQSKIKLFTNDWQLVKDDYFTDKVINPSAVDQNKPWYLRGRFRDKYFVIRLVYDKPENNKITINFINTQYRASQR